MSIHRANLIKILREMGTNLDPYVMSDWELADEILRRVHLHKLERKHLTLRLKKCMRENENLRQLDITQYIVRKEEGYLKDAYDDKKIFATPASEME